MKKIILIIAIFYSVYSFSQTNKVAILDFENTSGKSEYDALGKSLSNMLITDLKNNIHPKKVEFYERAQLNKLLEEQKLQKSKNFDAKTAVDFGKLSGVNYVFVGAVFVLEGNCNITSKLVDVKTSKILVTKEVNGKIESWLSLKSELAETIAKELNSPINLENEYKIVSTSLSTLNQYGKILSTMDTGDSEKAEQLRSVFEETNPDFKYFKDIKGDIEELKKQVTKNTADIEVLNKSGGRIVNAKSLNELIVNITNPLTTYSDRKNYMTDILKFETNEISVLLGQFSSICNQPSGIELLMAQNDQKVIELYQNDLDYITSLFNNKTINKKTFSYYVYYYLRIVRTNKHKSLIPKVIEVCEKLNTYNAINRIEPYDVMVFSSGGFAFFSNRGNDLNLSVDHLIELLKEEQ
jgi:TolB-like protein